MQFTQLNFNEIFTTQNIIIYFIVINIIGFFIMWLDKRKAIKGSWRIPEKTLIMVRNIGWLYWVYDRNVYI